MQVVHSPSANRGSGMKVLTLMDVHIRAKNASREAPKKGVVFKGFEIEVDGIVAGERIDGNDVWYRDLNGDFIWSGGTTRVEEGRRVQVGEESVSATQMTPSQRSLQIGEIWKHTRGAGVRVAVIDTGLDASHPSLRGGFREGFNANDSGDASDRDGHGTQCAGIIAARGAGRMIGVAPECELYAAKIMNMRVDGFLVADMERAFRWAIDHEVDVISVSLGISADENGRLRQAVKTAVDAGITVVAAIGNTNRHTGDPDVGDFPAKCPGCVSVGAVNDELELMSYTKRNAGLTICAPGHDVLSTGLGGSFSTHRCTSLAAPFVAGVVALMKSKRKEAMPGEIEHALVSTAAERVDDGYSYRIIQPLAAYEAL